MFFVDRSIGTCSKMPKLLRDPRSEVLGSKLDLGPFSKNFTYKISKTNIHVLNVVFVNVLLSDVGLIPKYIRYINFCFSHFGTET